MITFRLTCKRIITLCERVRAHIELHCPRHANVFAFGTAAILCSVLSVQLRNPKCCRWCCTQKAHHRSRWCFEWHPCNCLARLSQVLSIFSNNLHNSSDSLLSSTLCTHHIACLERGFHFYPRLSTISNTFAQTITCICLLIVNMFTQTLTCVCF